MCSKGSVWLAVFFFGLAAALAAGCGGGDEDKRELGEYGTDELCTCVYLCKAHPFFGGKGCERVMGTEECIEMADEDCRQQNYYLNGAECLTDCPDCTSDCAVLWSP